MEKSKVTGKTYFMAKLVKDTKVEPEIASFLYDTLFNAMLKSLEKGNEIILPGIGRICSVPSRASRSNMTGVMIPMHKRIKYKPNLKLALKIRVESREHPITIK